VADFRVDGAEQLTALAKRLRAESKELQRELPRAMNRATKGARAAVKAEALATLPRRGGLGKRVASSRLTTRTRRSGRAAGVRIVAKGGVDIGALDRGRLRHPLFGDRRRWFAQKVRPGWFTRPLTAAAPRVRAEIETSMRVIAGKIEKG